MNSSVYERIYRKSTIDRINKKCKLLGSKSKINPYRFLNIRFIVTLTLFILLLIIKTNGYIWAPIFAVITYYLSEFILDNEVKKRANKLNNEAIFFLQVLVLSLESGRNLKSALELTTKNIDSEISDEFKKTLNEVEFGKTLTEALVDMKERIPSDEVNTVLLNITQSTIFGNNVVDSLNNQIDYLSERKILNIKAKINKMPVKVSVISVVFIIPIVLLLILGPVLINYLIK